MRNKPIAFRPSDKSLAILQEYKKNHSLDSDSQATNEIIEAHQTLEVPEDITGVLLPCPLRPYHYFDDRPLCKGLKVNLHVDTSVCKSCSRYPCESWKDAESWQRIEKPSVSYAKT